MNCIEGITHVQYHSGKMLLVETRTPGSTRKSWFPFRDIGTISSSITYEDPNAIEEKNIREYTILLELHSGTRHSLTLAPRNSLSETEYFSCISVFKAFINDWIQVQSGTVSNNCDGFKTKNTVAVPPAATSPDLFDLFNDIRPRRPASPRDHMGRHFAVPG